MTTILITFRRILDSAVMWFCEARETVSYRIRVELNLTTNRNISLSSGCSKSEVDVLYNK